MIEEWKTIDGYDLYEVSNLGRVKRTKILKGRKSGSGYLVVSLCLNSKPKNFYIHQLVAKAFIKQNGQRVVNHKNGDKEDNRAVNLEWVTQSENIRHSYDIGLRQTNPISGFRGVRPYRNRFMARVHKGGKTLYVGLYNTAEQAYQAYIKANSEK